MPNQRGGSGQIEIARSFGVIGKSVTALQRYSGRTSLRFFYHVNDIVSDFFNFMKGIWRRKPAVKENDGMIKDFCNKL